jgi:alpha-tubulin suppressor-like RCC1 family protein
MDIAGLTAGGSHTCVVLADHSVRCWGRNDDGQLGDGSTADAPTPVEVTALGASIAEVSAGYEHTCARKTDGTLWCWGGNEDGQLGDGTTQHSSLPAEVAGLGATVAEVSGRYQHTCARKTDGRLWCWGNNLHGQVGDGTSVDALAPIEVTALGSSVAGVAAGANHTCAIKTDGTLWCWGWNFDGQLGVGTTTGNVFSPVEVTALGSSVAEVAIGFDHTCARMTDGTLWCWGEAGQVGDGTDVLRDSPVEIVGLGATVAGVAAGMNHTCAIKTDGTLWCWGNLLVGTTLSPTQVTAFGCP